MLWTEQALKIPEECLPVRAEFLKIEDGDTFPFVLRIEKEELQVQSNGFHLVIGGNIPSHKLCIGIRHKKYSWFSGTLREEEGGTEWCVEGTQPRSLKEQQEEEVQMNPQGLCVRSGC